METYDVEQAIIREGTIDDINRKEDVEQFCIVHGWIDLTISELDFEYIPPENRDSLWDSESDIPSNVNKLPTFRQTKITDFFYKKYGMMGNLLNLDYDFTEVNQIQDEIDSNEDNLMNDRLEDLRAYEEGKMTAYFTYMEEVEMYLVNRCPICQHSPCWWEQNHDELAQWCIDHIGENEVWDDMLAKWCRHQVTREVNRRLHGPDANLLQTLPVCWRIGVFRLYLPYHIKTHFWDPIFWDEE